MFVPGSIISLLTAPGVIIHEWSHALACKRRGIRIYEIVYFQTGTPTGYVHHEQPRRYWDAFMISFAPFAVNTMAAFAFLFVAFFRPDFPGFPILWAVFMWVGFSAGMQAFPSGQDAKQVWNFAKSYGWLSTKMVITGPIVLFIYIANLLRVVWSNLIYTFLIWFVAAFVFEFFFVPA